MSVVVEDMATLQSLLRADDVGVNNYRDMISVIDPKTYNLNQFEHLRMLAVDFGIDRAVAGTTSPTTALAAFGAGVPANNLTSTYNNSTFDGFFPIRLYKSDVLRESDNAQIASLNATHFNAMEITLHSVGTLANQSDGLSSADSFAEVFVQRGGGVYLTYKLSRDMVIDLFGTAGTNAMLLTLKVLNDNNSLSTYKPFTEDMTEVKIGVSSIDPTFDPDLYITVGNNPGENWTNATIWAYASISAELANRNAPGTSNLWEHEVVASNFPGVYFRTGAYGAATPALQIMFFDAGFNTSLHVYHWNSGGSNYNRVL